MTLNIVNRPRLKPGKYPGATVKRGDIAYGAARLSMGDGTSTEIFVGSGYIQARIATREEVIHGDWNKLSLQQFVQHVKTQWSVTEEHIIGEQSGIKIHWVRPRPEDGYALYCNIDNHRYSVERTNGCHADFYDPTLLGDGTTEMITGFEIH